MVEKTGVQEIRTPTEFNNLLFKWDVKEQILSIMFRGSTFNFLLLENNEFHIDSMKLKK